MTGRTKEELRRDILDSLRMVIDPELGESLVDLGLIYRIEVGDRAKARVEMSTTTKGCPAAAYLRDAVHSAVSIVPGIEDVEVLLVYEPAWSPDLMAETVRHRFGFGRGEVRR
ncbi:MAG: metal-sulfur cluster assembly factor [Rhizobiales bacterium]|nr:metal-sulfur cluster assembly factor [Hyphomicrobiales bacterium]